MLQTPQKVNPDDFTLDLSKINSPQPITMPTTYSMPPGHENFSSSSIDQCPFMVNLSNQQNSNIENKQKKPKSACPLMLSDKKKNPPLEPLTFSYNLPYISPWRFALTFKGFYTGSEPLVCTKWDTYPIYLKHSLFFNDEVFVKTRTLEIGHRYFVFDKLKEAGNKSMHKKDYQEALSSYEQALSLCKWIEFVPQTDNSNDLFKNLIENEPDDSDDEAKNKNKNNTAENKKAPLTESEKEKNIRMRQLLLTSFHDGNTILHDGEEVTNASDKELKDSIMFNVYLNLSVCYMKLFHFSSGLQALNDAEKIYDKNSILFYRKAQCIVYNRESRYEDLLNARECIKKAIDLKHYEKVFQNNGPMLKIINLHNAHEAYADLQKIVEKSIEEKKKNEILAIRKILDDAVLSFQNDEKMTNQGELLLDENEPDYYVSTVKDENLEINVLTRMIGKYARSIEFNQESKELDKVALAKKEMLSLKEIFYKFLQYWDMKFDNNIWCEEILADYPMLDLNKMNVKQRLYRLKRAAARNIMETAGINFEVYKYAYEEYIQEWFEAEKKLTKKTIQDGENEHSKLNNLRKLFALTSKNSNFEAFLRIGFAISILVGLYYIFWSQNWNILN